MTTIRPYRQKVAQSKELTCERCGATFYNRQRGRPKYCLVCRDIVYVERSKESSRRHNEKRKLRAKEKVQGGIE